MTFSASDDELKITVIVNNDNSKENYNKIRNNTSIINMACRTYLSKIPDVETNLEAIQDDYDKNYVFRDKSLCNEEKKLYVLL
jgi:hypothetical protein